MGVIYKLKPEVVEYIVKQKNDIPNISCRKLADIVSEKFQVKVSKSSINNILKNARLSSPVGRRSFGEKKPKKFKLPAIQKEQLFPSKSLLPSKKTPSSLASQKKLADGAGCIFLKAAEWDVKNPLIFSDVFRSSVSSEFSEQAGSIGPALLYLEAFGIPGLKGLEGYKGSGLWSINGLDKPLEYKDVVRCVQAVQDFKSLNLKMSNEKPQAFVEGNCFKAELVNGKAFFIDAQLRSLWGKSVHSKILSPINKLIKTLSEDIINNVHSVILSGVPGEDKFEDVFYDFLSSFENKEDHKISKISILNKDQDILAEFDAIPDKRRYFIISTWPGQEGFSTLAGLEAFKKNEEYRAEAIENAVFYSETETSLQSGPVSFPVRAIGIRNDPQKEPVAILITNIPKEAKKAQAVLEEYLLRWPYLQEGHQDFWASLKGDASSSPNYASEEAIFEPGRDFYGEEGFWVNIHNVLMGLNAYAQKSFFPEKCQNLGFSEIQERFYALSGSFEKGDKSLIVQLEPPQGYPYLQDLKYAIRRFNEGNVFTDSGQKVTLKLPS